MQHRRSEENRRHPAKCPKKVQRHKAHAVLQKKQKGQDAKHCKRDLVGLICHAKAGAVQQRRDPQQHNSPRKEQRIHSLSRIRNH